MDIAKVVVLLLTAAAVICIVLAEINSRRNTRALKEPSPEPNEVAETNEKTRR